MSRVDHVVGGKESAPRVGRLTDAAVGAERVGGKESGRPLGHLTDVAVGAERAGEKESAPWVGHLTGAETGCTYCSRGSQQVGRG
jgi:hypothetical protein